MIKKIIFISSVALALGACGKGLTTAQKKATETTSPSLEEPATIDYQLSIFSFGRLNVTDYNGSKYLHMRGSDDYDYLSKFTGGVLDTTFGKNGYLSLNSPDSGLKLNILPYSNFRMQSCNGKIYAFAQNSDDNDGYPRAYVFTSAANGLTSANLDFHIVNNAMEGFQDLISMDCAGDYLFLFALKNSDPSYRAIISIRTTDNNISFYKTEDISTFAGIHKSSTGYTLVAADPDNNYVISHQDLVVDDSDHQITPGSFVANGNLAAQFGVNYRIITNGNSTYLAGVNDDGIFRVLKGSFDEIHTAITTNTFDSSKLNEFQLTFPTNFMYYSENNFCVTSSGNFWSVMYMSKTSDWSNFSTRMIVLDTRTTPMTAATSVNGGLPVTIDNELFSDSWGYIGHAYATTTCSGDSIQQLYPNINNVLQYKNFTPQ